MGDHTASSRRFARVPLSILLAVAVSVPLASVVAIAAQAITTRWDHRQVSLEQQALARDLGAVVEARAALAEEETYSTIAVVASQLDLDLGPIGPGGSYERSLVAARERVDAALDRRPLPGLADRATSLRAVREEVDQGSPELLTVDAAFAGLEQVIDEEISQLDRRIEAANDARPTSDTARARARVLRYTVEGVRHSSVRIGDALVLLSPTPPETVTPVLLSLIRETALFNATFDRAVPQLGPRASEAWRARQADPSVRRIEELMDVAVDVGMGQADLPLSDPTSIVEILADGLEWATRTTDVLQAVVADLEATTSEIVADDTRTVTVWTVGAVALVGVALLGVIVVGRSLRRAAEDLEVAARRIQQGEFDLPPLAPAGSRELAATVVAFNEMAATLEAVERHAIALAEEPDSPVLAEPLPGRTGEALQEALDALRSSIRQAEQRRVELEELASHDGLTGLLNRRAAFDALERELARSRRDGTSLMVLYIDLDGLKVINDTHGHIAGDVAIRTTADVLLASSRRSDLVARLGGDEFLIAGPVPAGAEGQALVGAAAQRLLDAISSATATLDDGTVIPLQASVGVATSSDAAETVEDLVRRADAALYVAKQAGRQQLAWPEQGR